MGQVRNRRLDEACRTFAEGSGLIARGKTLQAGAKHTALTEMKAKHLVAHRNYGIAFSFVPGTDTVQARKVGEADNTAADEAVALTDDELEPEDDAAQTLADA